MRLLPSPPTVLVRRPAFGQVARRPGPGRVSGVGRLPGREGREGGARPGRALRSCGEV